MGHSWGSVLGNMFALEHPEHTLCYIGCGQVINIMENERTGYGILKDAIEKSDNRKDRKKLNRIGEYPVDYFDMDVYRKMGEVRKLQGKYHLAQDFGKEMISLWWKSPIMGMKDFLPFIAGARQKTVSDSRSRACANAGSSRRLPPGGVRNCCCAA